MRISYLKQKHIRYCTMTPGREDDTKKVVTENQKGKTTNGMTGKNATDIR